MPICRSLFLLCLILALAGCAAPAAAPTPTAAAPTFAAPGRTPAPPPSPTPAPTAAPTQPPVCAETAGQVVDAQMESQYLPRPLQVRLYLPPCYQARPAQPYPLLVLLHGQGSDAGQWERLGVTTRADWLMRHGLLPPLLIAMPYEQDSLADPSTSPYAQTLAEEMLPWLAGEYGACAERGCRAVGGISRGAAWAARLALEFDQPFGAAGLHSLAPFYGDYNRLPYQVREIPAGQMPAVWMDSGSHDRYLSQARYYHELLEDYGVAHVFQLFAGEHDEVYWTRGIDRYLRWYGQQLAQP